MIHVNYNQLAFLGEKYVAKINKSNSQTCLDGCSTRIGDLLRKLMLKSVPMVLEPAGLCGSICHMEQGAI